MLFLKIIIPIFTIEKNVILFLQELKVFLKYENKHSKY